MLSGVEKVLSRLRTCWIHRLGTDDMTPGVELVVTRAYPAWNCEVM